jgi:hypothetical protein
MAFWKKITLEVVNLFLNNQIAFMCMKRFNLFQAVFVMYPATSFFADHFTFSWRQKRITWKPFMTGFIKHPSGALTLCFAISATEDDIHASSNANFVRVMYEEVKEMQRRVGAKTNHLAGTLPSRLAYLRTKRENNEQKSTAANVVSAILRFRKTFNHDSANPVILLGYRGFVGREVKVLLEKYNISVEGVDLGDTLVAPVIPHLVVNITRPEALNPHIPSLNKYSLVLNEVYPEPHHDVVFSIKEIGAHVSHIAGVQAFAFPSFPGAYKGAVPCCAALPDETYDICFVSL